MPASCSLFMSLSRNLSIISRKKMFFNIMGAAMGLIIWEILNALLGGICDYRDIIATIVGGIIAFGIYSMVKYYF